MKKVILFAFILSSNFLVAQNTEPTKEIVFSFSEPFEGMSSYMGFPLGYRRSFVSNGEINSFQFDAGKFSFMKYTGPSLNETLRNDVLKGESFTIQGVEQLGNRYYFFFSRWSKLKKSEQLFVREIDFEKCDFAEPDKLLFESTGKLTPVSYSLAPTYWMPHPTFKRTKSLDRSKLLVTYTLRLKGKENKTKNQEIGLHVYDDSMIEQWQRVVELPYKSGNTSILDYAIDQHSNVFILVKISNDSSDDRKDKIGSQLIVFFVNGKTGHVTSTDISMDGFFVEEVRLSENKKGQIVAFGLYAKFTTSLTDGVFATTLSENGEISISQKIEIPDSVIAQHHTERLQQKIERSGETSNWGLSNLVLKDAIFGNNGSITLFAEALYIGTYTDYSTRRGPNEKSNIRLGNILVAHIEPDNSLSRFSKIPKRQVGETRGSIDRKYVEEFSYQELGCVVMNKHHNPYVLFIDNNKNINLPKSEVPQVHRSGLGGYLRGYKFDQQTGAFENMTFFDLKNAHGKILKQFSIIKVFQLSENEIAIEFATDVPKKNIFVKLNLPE